MTVSVLGWRLERRQVAAWGLVAAALLFVLLIPVVPLLRPLGRTDPYVAAWLLVLALAPGAVPGAAVARRLSWGLPGFAAAAFTWSVFEATLVWLLSLWLGFSLTTGTYVYLGIAAALTVPAAFIQRGTPGLRGGGGGIVLAFLASALALYERPWFLPTGDALYHIAAVRSLIARGEFVVTDPLHGTAMAIPDPTSGVLHSMMGVWSQARGFDPLAVYFGLAGVGTFLVACAVWALLRRASASDRAATIAAFAFLAIGLYADFRSMSLPNRVSLAIAFLGLLALYESAERPSHTSTLAAVAAGMAAAGSHIATAVLLFAGAVAVALGLAVLHFADWRRTRVLDRKGLLAPALGVLATGVTIAMIMLPKATLLFAQSDQGGEAEWLTRAGVLDVPLLGKMLHPDYFFEGKTGLLVLSVAIAVFAIRRAFTRGDRLAMSVAATTLLPAALMMTPWVTSLLFKFSYYMVFRLLGISTVFPYIAIAWALGHSPQVSMRPLRWFLPWMAMAAALLAALPYLLTVFTAQHVEYEDTLRGMHDRTGTVALSLEESRRVSVLNRLDLPAISRIRSIVGDRYPRVVAEPISGYHLASLVPVSLVAAPDHHHTVTVESIDGEERREEMEAFFKPYASAERRRSVMEKWDSKYVYLWLEKAQNRRAAESLLAQPETFAPVVVWRREAFFELREETSTVPASGE